MSFVDSIEDDESWWFAYNIAAILSCLYYNDVILSAMASQITGLTIICSTVYSDADQRKYQSSASLAFVWGVNWWPVNSPHKGAVTRKMFPFDDVPMHVDMESSTKTYGMCCYR